MLHDSMMIPHSQIPRHEVADRIPNRDVTQRDTILSSFERRQLYILALCVEMAVGQVRSLAGMVMRRFRRVHQRKADLRGKEDEPHTALRSAIMHGIEKAELYLEPGIRE